MCLFDCSAQPYAQIKSSWQQEFCSFQAVCHISVVFICRMYWWTCYQCIPPVWGGKKCRLVIRRCWNLKWCNERKYEWSTISVPLVLLSSLIWLMLKRQKRSLLLLQHVCFYANKINKQSEKHWKSSCSSNNCCFKGVLTVGIPHQDCASRMREKQKKRRILNSRVLNKRQEAAVSQSSSCGYQVYVYADETVLCNKSLNHNSAS